MSISSGLEQFAHQNYLNLETFRKSGVGVQTPVWFVEADGHLYVRTMTQSAKVKRLCRNAHVRVAPCEVGGNLKGEWKEADARVLTDESDAARINKLANQKYGLIKQLFELRYVFMKPEMATIEIVLQNQAAQG